MLAEYGIAAGKGGAGGGAYNSSKAADWMGMAANDPMTLLIAGGVFVLGVYVLFLR